MVEQPKKKKQFWKWNFTSTWWFCHSFTPFNHSRPEYSTDRGFWENDSTTFFLRHRKEIHTHQRKKKLKMWGCPQQNIRQKKMTISKKRHKNTYSLNLWQSNWLLHVIHLFYKTGTTNHMIWIHYSHTSILFCFFLQRITGTYLSFIGGRHRNMLNPYKKDLSPTRNSNLRPSHYEATALTTPPPRYLTHFPLILWKQQMFVVGLDLKLTGHTLTRYFPI